MTLDEAIKHCEKVAKEQDKLCKRYDDASGYTRSHNEDIRTTDAKRCEECAKEHRQLAEWLKELKALREQTKWTLVSDDLPKEHICDDGYVEPSDAVLITTKSGDIKVSRYWGNRWSKITEEAEGRSPEYYDWIEAELWENDVIAWMPLPQPYKAESEE